MDILKNYTVQNIGITISLTAVSDQNILSN